MARKRRSKPTGNRRSEKQRIKDRFAHAYEDALLAGVLPMRPGKPEETLKLERVDPSAQGDSTDHLSLVAVAARNNWATPDEVKPQVVDNLAKIAVGGGGETVLDENGVAISTGPSLKTQVYAAKVLTEIDQIQYERDHPDEAGKAKGGTKVLVPVTVNNQPVTDIGDLIRKAREQRGVGKKAQGELGSREVQKEDEGIQQEREMAQIEGVDGEAGVSPSADDSPDYDVPDSAVDKPRTRVTG